MLGLKKILLRFRRFVKDSVFELLGITNHLSSPRYIKKLRSSGSEIGDGTKFFGEKCLDLGNPQMITIGKNCVMTDGVRILTHAWDKPILSNLSKPAPEFSKVGKVTIGNNVFVGERSIILPDTKIGSNCIIGAGSVVTSDIPSESVAAGNPCHVICSIEEYREQRVSQETSDIQEYVKESNEREIQIHDKMEEYVHSDPK